MPKMQNNPLWIQKVLNMQDQTTTTQQEIIQTIATKKTQWLLLENDIANKLQETGLDWSEFCEYICDQPCQYDCRQAHWTCQFEILRYLNKIEEVSDKAYPKWVKRLKKAMREKTCR